MRISVRGRATERRRGKRIKFCLHAFRIVPNDEMFGSPSGMSARTPRMLGQSAAAPHALAPDGRIVAGLDGRAQRRFSTGPSDLRVGGRCHLCDRPHAARSAALRRACVGLVGQVRARCAAAAATRAIRWSATDARAPSCGRARSRMRNGKLGVPLGCGRIPRQWL